MIHTFLEVGVSLLLLGAIFLHIIYLFSASSNLFIAKQFSLFLFVAKTAHIFKGFPILIQTFKHNSFNTTVDKQQQKKE
jgi:hypothetical protein